MKRVVIAALIASFITVGAFPATKPASKKSKSAAPAAQKAITSQVTSTPVPLVAMFPPSSAAQETVAAGGMVTMDAPNHEVVMVRINADGTRSHACVNDEASARKFLSGAKDSTSATHKE
jgi:hypothetical protein